MSLVELFKKGPENINEKKSLAFSLLQTEMSVFMLDLDVEVLQVNGPYINHLPPEREGLPERIFYTANIRYHRKS